MAQLDEFMSSSGVSAKHLITIEKTPVTVIKSRMIAELPKILTIHFNRNRTSNTGKIIRDQQHVEFPVSLSTSTLKTDPSIPERHYKLKSMIVHSGSAARGHYTAVKRCYEPGYDNSGNLTKKGEWILCNDQKTLAHRQDEVRAKNAYMLFYELD